MLNATSANHDTNVGNHAEPFNSPIPSTNYSCTSCKITFKNGQEQRIHMKQPWHVYNIKRRIASLPPITQHAFNVEIENSINTDDTSLGLRRSGDAESLPENDDEENPSPFQCLFCSHRFTSNDTGFATNLEHMRIIHGLSIPRPEMVHDMQSFVGYLATEVREWHECLYCGAIRSSTESIQSHMRDEGHCLLNFDREPELLHFWESPWLVNEIVDTPPEQERLTYLSETEIRLDSGKVINSRGAALARRKESRKRCLAALTKRLGEENTELPSLAVGPQLASRNQIARREEMGIRGISEQQRHSLVLAEKKAQRCESVARRAREWLYAKGANSQKFDQVDNQMKWGKQNHKLFPR